MLHAISGKDFDAAVVEQHQNVHGHFARRRTEHLLHPVVEPQQLRGGIEAGFRRKQRIEFLIMKIRADGRAFNKHAVVLRSQLSEMRGRRGGGYPVFVGRTLIILGLVLVVVGMLITFGERLPVKLGRLPGDIVIRGKNSVFYFPIVTSLLLSAILTLAMWLFNRREAIFTSLRRRETPLQAEGLPHIRLAQKENGRPLRATRSRLTCSCEFREV